jgi:hypothetical protein
MAEADHEFQPVARGRRGRGRAAGTKTKNKISSAAGFRPAHSQTIGVARWRESAKVTQKGQKRTMLRKFASLKHPMEFGYAYDSEAWTSRAPIDTHFRMFQTYNDGLCQHSGDSHPALGTMPAAEHAYDFIRQQKYDDFAGSDADAERFWRDMELSAQDWHLFRAAYRSELTRLEEAR